MIDEPGRPIPVALSEPVGGAAASFVNCPPVIHVYLGADPDWSPTSTESPRHSGKPYMAMLDTGSDHVSIRPDVAAAIGARPRGNGVVLHGFGGARSGIQRATIQVIVPAATIFFLADAAIIELSGSARSFDLTLGRAFLRHCRLFVDGPNGCYRLEWVR